MSVRRCSQACSNQVGRLAGRSMQHGRLRAGMRAILFFSVCLPAVWVHAQQASWVSSTVAMTQDSATHAGHAGHDMQAAEAIALDEAGKLAAIERLMQPYDGDVPGASLLVVKDGQVVLRRGFGRSDLAKGVDADPATNYRLASVTKPFTAAAILLLAQEGKLSLDDPVKRWLPSLPQVADGITIRHLLNHTSGLLDYEDLMAKPYEGQILDAGVLALMEQQDRLYFPPGSEYRYSNSGYALLALVAERASGMTFADYLRTHVFVPLGMLNTHARVEGGPEIVNRAWGYSAAEDGWALTDQNAYSAVLGDGGIYSNIDDLAKWDAAWTDDRLFSDATRELAFSKQVQVSSEPEATFYGYGWRVTEDGRRQWHNGESIGFRNAFVRWPEQHLTVVMLSNRNHPTPYDTAIEIGELFLQDMPASD